jgi:plasmid maintenance system antidote protein VapI
VNGKRGISPEMAIRLSKVFGGSAESWLVQQAQYDLAYVRVDRMKLKTCNWRKDSVERGEKIRVATAYDLDAGQEEGLPSPALARGVK